MHIRFSSSGKKKETKRKRGEYPELDEIANFSPEISAELVREGEKKVESQFTSMQASLTRGYGLSSILLSFAAASFAGLSLTDQSARIASGVASGGLFIAGFLAVISIWPSARNSPGNEPMNWRSSQWHKPIKATYQSWYRVEQSKVLQCQIDENRKDLKKIALLHRGAISVAYAAVLIASGLYFFL